MFESSYIIRLNIRHYQALLKLRNVSEARRLAVEKLLAEAESQLPLAVSDETRSKDQAAA